MSASDLQFERADYQQAPENTVCAACNRAITSSYYLANERTLCGLCRNDLERAMNSGSRLGRFARATGAGLVAAFLGFLLYYGIARLTGYEFGLIAIVVGFGVGSAVRWGSNGRGGWAYQGLAMALTYLAIVTTYIPPMLEAFSGAEATLTEELETQAADEETETESTAAPSAEPASAAPDDATGAAASDGAVKLPVMFSILFLLVLACAAPFLAGFENIIGIIILAIGLYEAWKLNTRTVTTITGPHALARPQAAPAAGV